MELQLTYIESSDVHSHYEKEVIVPDLVYRLSDMEQLEGDLMKS